MDHNPLDTCFVCGKKLGLADREYYPIGDKSFIFCRDCPTPAWLRNDMDVWKVSFPSVEPIYFCDVCDAEDHIKDIIEELPNYKVLSITREKMKILQYVFLQEFQG